MFWKFLAISPVLFLMSCASLTEEACRTGDWATIGYNDGTRGRYENYINEHREACSEYGIVPNSAVWLRGRIEGLKQYCTPQNAYTNGRRGDELNNVCPSEQISELRLANFFGLRYYEIDREIDALTDELEEIQYILATNFQGDLTPEQVELQNFYMSQVIDLKKSIFALELELLKFASLP